LPSNVPFQTRNLATPILVHALFNSAVLGLYAVWVASAPAGQ